MSSPAPAPATSATPTGAAAAPPAFAWQTCLDVRHTDGHIYQDHFNPGLLEVLAHPPRTLLDIGCAAGLIGREIKSRDPSCRTIGIEPNEATAKLATQNLDRVLCGKLEDIDLEAEGIGPGSIDTVIAADVLEHMYDPWHAMTGLKPYLSKEAQIILSIPNTRHLGLMKALVDDGNWTYAKKGLLDITHIRFFTLREIGVFLDQTGYRMEQVNFFIDPILDQFYTQSRNQPEINVRVGRMSLEKITQQELAELCTWQFFIRARPV